MDGLIRWLLGSALRVAVLAGGLALLALLVSAWLHGRPRRWRLAAGDALLVGSMALVALVTLVPVPVGDQPDRINLLPFRDLAWAAQGRVDAGLALVGLTGNVLLFVPLGAAAALRFPAARLASIVVIGLTWSLAVEAGQALLDIGRLADVTDVLVNTGGTALGAWLWRSLASAQAEPHAEMDDQR